MAMRCKALRITTSGQSVSDSAASRTMSLQVTIGVAPVGSGARMVIAGMKKPARGGLGGRIGVWRHRAGLVAPSCGDAGITSGGAVYTTCRNFVRQTRQSGGHQTQRRGLRGQTTSFGPRSMGQAPGRRRGSAGSFVVRPVAQVLGYGILRRGGKPVGVSVAVLFGPRLNLTFGHKLAAACEANHLVQEAAAPFGARYAVLRQRQHLPHLVPLRFHAQSFSLRAGPPNSALKRTQAGGQRSSIP